MLRITITKCIRNTLHICKNCYIFAYMEHNCKHCKKPFIKRRKDHVFCKGGCRAMYHNIRKGNKFTQQIEANKQKPSVISQLNPSLNKNRTISKTAINPNHMVVHLTQHLTYLQNLLYEAQNGTYLLSTLTLGSAGLGVGYIADLSADKDIEYDEGVEDDEGVNGSLLGAIIGAGVGLYVDNKIKQNTIIEITNAIIDTQNKLKAAQKWKLLFDKVQLNKKPSESTIKLPDLPSGVITGDQLSKMEFKTLSMANTYWGYLWGADIADPFYSIAYGLPSQGKSTFSIAFADYFNKNHGKTLFMASEQGIAQSLKGIIDRTNSKQLHIDGNPNDKTVEQHIKDINNFNYKLVIIDSATHMNYGFAVIERMRKATPNCSYMVILQSVKDGDFKGDNQWAHNCDIMVNINDGKAQVKKTRFMKMNNEWVDIPSLK